HPPLVHAAHGVEQERIGGETEIEQTCGLRVLLLEVKSAFRPSQEAEEPLLDLEPDELSHATAVEGALLDEQVPEPPSGGRLLPRKRAGDGPFADTLPQNRDAAKPQVLLRSRLPDDLTILHPEREPGF